MKNILVGITVLAVILAAVWLLSGHQFAEAPVKEANTVSVEYACNDGKSIAAVFHNAEPLPPAAEGEPPVPQGSVDLVLSDGRAMTLKQTLSASGVRYSDGDPLIEGGETFVFWSKGDEALVLENNEEKSYLGCTAVPVE
jgi:membrane-bound inhibitor of C-type lysozyme